MSFRYHADMPDAFSRTALLIGSEGLARLEASTVAVFGLGGVGSYAAEALAFLDANWVDLASWTSTCQ